MKAYRLDPVSRRGKPNDSTRGPCVDECQHLDPGTPRRQYSSLPASSCTPAASSERHGIQGWTAAIPILPRHAQNQVPKVRRGERCPPKYQSYAESCTERTRNCSSAEELAGPTASRVLRGGGLVAVVAEDRVQLFLGYRDKEGSGCNAQGNDAGPCDEGYLASVGTAGLSCDGCLGRRSPAFRRSDLPTISRRVDVEDAPAGSDPLRGWCGDRRDRPSALRGSKIHPISTWPALGFSNVATTSPRRVVFLVDHGE